MNNIMDYCMQFYKVFPIVQDLSRFNVRPSLDTLDYIFDGQSLINVSATIPKIPVVGASSTVSVESVINHVSWSTQ